MLCQSTCYCIKQECSGWSICNVEKRREDMKNDLMCSLGKHQVTADEKLIQQM